MLAKISLPTPEVYVKSEASASVVNFHCWLLWFNLERGGGKRRTLLCAKAANHNQTAKPVAVHPKPKGRSGQKVVVAVEDNMNIMCFIWRQRQFIDPVCGMSVDPNTELKKDYQQQTYYFCNPSCLQISLRLILSFIWFHPISVLTWRRCGYGLYLSDGPWKLYKRDRGTCPICGMALEPMQPTLDDAPNPEVGGL